MRLITAQEIIQIHDDILERLAGVKGMPDPGRADWPREEAGRVPALRRLGHEARESVTPGAARAQLSPPLTVAHRPQAERRSLP